MFTSSPVTSVPDVDAAGAEGVAGMSKRRICSGLPPRTRPVGVRPCLRLADGEWEDISNLSARDTQRYLSWTLCIHSSDSRLDVQQTLCRHPAVTQSQWSLGWALGCAGHFQEHSASTQQTFSRRSAEYSDFQRRLNSSTDRAV